MKMNHKYVQAIFILSILLFACIIFSITIGSANISFIDSLKIVIHKILFNNIINLDGISNSHIQIIENIRLPRILITIIVGAGLSVCGAVYQGTLKNNMADPYVLGVSSGAALGATISIVYNFLDIKIMAFAFAILITAFVYILSKKTLNKNSIFMILTGINVNFFLSAIVALLMILNRNQLDKVVLWTMGSFASNTWADVITTAIIIIPSIIFLSLFGKYLNAISLDENTAKSIGINTALFRKIMIVITSLITAVCVSTSGIIGFVGLMIPHLIRMWFGADYRYLISLSALAGAIFLCVSDGIARTVISPTELPIGIITSMVGAPFLIYLIYKKR